MSNSLQRIMPSLTITKHISVGACIIYNVYSQDAEWKWIAGKWWLSTYMKIGGGFKNIWLFVVPSIICPGPSPLNGPKWTYSQKNSQPCFCFELNSASLKCILHSAINFMTQHALCQILWEICLLWTWTNSIKYFQRFDEGRDGLSWREGFRNSFHSMAKIGFQTMPIKS